MKKILLLFFLILLFSCSKKEIQPLSEKITLNESIEVSRAFLKNNLREYNEKCFTELIKTIDDKSGFLGWRNIRDYFGFGEEELGKKIIRDWENIYDNEHANDLYKINLNELLSGTRLNKNNYIFKIPKNNNIIQLYAHKIGLSAGLLIIELIIESFLLYWIVYGIAFFLAFTIGIKTKKKISKSGCLVSLIIGISVILGNIVFYITEDYSQEKLKQNLIKNNVKYVLDKTSDSYKKINIDYTNYKN